MNLCKRFIEWRRERRIAEARWVCAPCSHRYKIECCAPAEDKFFLSLAMRGPCHVCVTQGVVYQTERAYRAALVQDVLDRQQPVRSGGAS